MQRVTYALRTHVRKSTGTPTFSLVLPHHTPRPKTGSQPIALTSNTDVKTSPSAIWLSLQHSIDAQQMQGDERLRGHQTRYKRNYNAKVGTEPKFLNKQWVFIENQPFTAEATTANSLVTSSYIKLQHRTAGP